MTRPAAPLEEEDWQKERDRLARKHYDEYVELDEQNANSLNWIAPRFSAFCYGWDASRARDARELANKDVCIAELKAEVEHWKSLSREHQDRGLELEAEVERLKVYEETAEKLGMNLVNERAARQKAEAERDGLVKALEKITAKDEDSFGLAMRAKRIAREALKALEPKC